MLVEKVFWSLGLSASELRGLGLTRSRVSRFNLFFSQNRPFEAMKFEANGFGRL